MKNNITKKLALCGILTALSLIAFMLENLAPPIVIPGAKLGLSNIFILLSTLICGIAYGYASLILKCVLGSVFSGNISAVIYSLPAGIIALTAEILIIFYIKKTSVVSASVFGAVINVTVQNIIFCLVTNSMEFIVYIPYLALIGVISGAIVGLSVWLIVKKTPNLIKEKFSNEKEYI